MPSIQTRKCSACGRKYDVLRHPQGDTALDRDDIENLACPDCDATAFEPLIGLATGIELGGEGGVGKHYPYDDPQLGVRIHSAAHRRRVLKERGLVALEGGMTDMVERQMADEERRIAEHERAWAEHQAMCDADPDVRRAQDRFAEIAATTRDPDEVRRAFYGR